MAGLVRATVERIAGQEGGPDVIPPPGRRLVDVSVVAAKYNCDPRTVYRWADMGRIPWGMKIGGLRRWDLNEVDQHIADGCKPVRATIGGGAR